MPLLPFVAYSWAIAISSLLQQVPTEISDPSTALLYLEYLDTDLKLSSNQGTYVSCYGFEALVILFKVAFETRKYIGID